MRNDCIFCAIIDGEIPSKKVYEDDKMIIINDINPICDNHYLVIPKQHFKYLEYMNDEQADLFKYCITKLRQLKSELHLENGFRVIINQGDDAGQTVPHLHIHILSGRKMSWQA